MDMPPNKTIMEKAVNIIAETNRVRKKNWEDSHVGDLVKIKRASIGIPRNSFGVIKKKTPTMWSMPEGYIVQFMNGQQRTFLPSELVNVSRQQRKKHKLYERMESDKQ